MQISWNIFCRQNKTKGRSNAHRRHRKVSYREVEMLKVVLYVMVQKEKEWSGWDLNNCYLLSFHSRLFG
jgi:hypothetical protein